MLFVKVADSSESECIELPVEPEGHILMSTLIAQFPGACGLKFKMENSSWRGVRVVDEKIYPPGEDNKWDENCIYHVTYPKDCKRKGDDLDINSAKSRKIEKKCVDLIVLGIPWKSSDDVVRRYFEQYGEVVLCEVKRDSSNNSKGFGFVRFKEYDNQCLVLGKKHFIDGRWCDVKIPNSQEPEVSRKIFVGRLTETLTSQDLHDYFSRFGQVIDVYIPKPFRAFGFVTFVEADIARALCGESHIIKGVSVHVSRADPKEEEDVLLSGGSRYMHAHHHYGHYGAVAHYGGRHAYQSSAPNGYHRNDTRASKSSNQMRAARSSRFDSYEHRHGSSNGGMRANGANNQQANDAATMSMMSNMFNPMMAAFIQQLASAQSQPQTATQPPASYAMIGGGESMMSPNAATAGTWSQAPPMTSASGPPPPQPPPPSGASAMPHHHQSMPASYQQASASIQHRFKTGEKKY